MSVTCKILFGYPQTEIASILRDRLQRCVSASLVVGFATVDGLAAIERSLLSPPTKLDVLVVGRGTFRAFDMMDKMLGIGVASNRLRVHLGHSRPAPGYNSNTFQWYRPMLHSKIYYCEMQDGTAAVFVGSNNLTHFAMNGLNGEASVLLEGPKDDPEFVAVRDHIAASADQAVEYDPSMKQALTFWTTKYLEGLRKKVNDIDEDIEWGATVLALSVAVEKNIPKRGDILYFEMPAGIPQVRVNAPVHVFGFGELPKSPNTALTKLPNARFKLRGKVIGVEKDTGAHEVEADWEITGATPMLRPTPQRRYRPPRNLNTIQVRVEVDERLKVFYEYIFGGPREEWLPVYDSEKAVRYPADEANGIVYDAVDKWFDDLKLNPPEDGEFQLVRGLIRKEQRGKGKQQYALALERASPESGSFILFSQGRRERPEHWLSSRLSDSE